MVPMRSFAILPQLADFGHVLCIARALCHLFEQLAPKLPLESVQLRLGFLRDEIHLVAALGLRAGSGERARPIDGRHTL